MPLPEGYETGLKENVIAEEKYDELEGFEEIHITYEILIYHRRISILF